MILGIWYRNLYKKIFLLLGQAKIDSLCAGYISLLAHILLCIFLISFLFLPFLSNFPLCSLRLFLVYPETAIFSHIPYLISPKKIMYGTLPRPSVVETDPDLGSKIIRMFGSGSVSNI